MVLRGRRLTVALVAALFAVVLAGAAAAWFVGGSRSDPGGTPAAPAAPTGPSDDPTVQLSPVAAQHPQSDAVADLLQRYFDAINDRDYQAWQATVTPDQSAAWPESGWQQAYRTTRESNIVVRSIDDDPLRVSLWFVSEQDEALAPPDLPVDCIVWTMTYLLEDSDGELLLGGIQPDSSSRQACS